MRTMGEVTLAIVVEFLVEERTLSPAVVPPVQAKLLPYQQSSCGTDTLEPEELVNSRCCPDMDTTKNYRSHTIDRCCCCCAPLAPGVVAPSQRGIPPPSVGWLQLTDSFSFHFGITTGSSRRNVPGHGQQIVGGIL